MEFSAWTRLASTLGSVDPGANHFLNLGKDKTYRETRATDFMQQRSLPHPVPHRRFKK